MNKRYKGLWITGLLFFVAFGMELLFIKSYHVSYNISPDGLLYSNIAENFLQGNGLINTEGTNGFLEPRDYVVGPIYPLLLALVYGIFGLKSYGMVIVLHAAFNAASAVLAYKTGELLFGKGYAWIPYCLTLGYPLFAFWGMYVLTESTYVFTITLFLYLLVRYSKEVNRPKVITILTLGVVIGISNLIKPFLLLFFPILGFWILWMQSGHLKKALRDFALIVIMTILVMSPWWIRNGLKYHEFIPVSNYGSFEMYVGNNPMTITDQYFNFKLPTFDPEVKARLDKLPLLEQEKEYKKLAVSYILQHPVLFLQRTLAKETNLFWQPVPPIDAQAYKMQGYALDKWYLILGLIGVILSFFQIKKYSFILLFTGYYSFVISMIIVVYGARYRLPVMPAMILFGSLVVVIVLKGIGKLFSNNSKTRKRPIYREKP